MTDSKAVQGKNMIASIKVGEIYYPVFCAKSCSFLLNNEIIRRTGVNDGLGVKRRVRRTEFSGSASGVTVTDNTSDRYSVFYLLQEAIRRSESDWEFEFTNFDGETKTITGVFLIEGIDVSGDVASFSQSTVNIIGSGLPIIDESPSSGGVDENVDSDWWETTVGTNSISGLSENGKSLIGKTILAIARNIDTLIPITTGTPVNDEGKFSSAAGSITVDASIPFESGERIWAMWKDA